MQQLREKIAENVDLRLDALEAAGSPADLHEIVSLPVPMTMICELLGVPYEDHEFFALHGTNLLGGHSTPGAASGRDGGGGALPGEAGRPQECASPATTCSAGRSSPTASPARSTRRATWSTCAGC
ncbi:hypothetical protein LT493_11840 [Streptomyces tricolor]|nr:hypothetical protein [Streptomyces tricolor]